MLNQTESVCILIMLSSVCKFGAATHHAGFARLPQVEVQRDDSGNLPDGKETKGYQDHGASCNIICEVQQRERGG